MTTATIVFSSKDNAPLFAHYQGQILPQPAYVTLDLESGEVNAGYSGEIGNAMPMRVWNGIVRRYSIRNDLNADQIREVLENILPTLQRVLDGSSVDWDGNNWAGRLNEDAQEAEGAIEDLGSDMENLVITNLAEWLAEGGQSCWMPDENQDIAEYIKNFDLNGYVTDADIGDVLKTMWADHLYNGDWLPTNVARALIEDGRCADSQWTEELAANAEGHIHENQQ